MRERISALRDAGAWRWLGLVVVVSVFTAGASGFLPHQTLWVDEATQMSGLGLGPSRVVGWLAGRERPDFDQYPDRTPPLSYWLGWAWSRVVGPGETSMRWFGLTCVALAVGLVYEGARCAFGVAAAWAAGLIFGLSPHVIVMAVEIRAYPLFLLWSAAAVFWTVRLLTTGPPPTPEAEGAAGGGDVRGRFLSYTGLAVSLSAAVATHFYGVVLAGAVLSALVIESRSRPGGRGPLVAVIGVVGTAVLAVTPFIVASTGLYGNLVGKGPGVGGRLLSIERLLVRLISHPALSLERPVAAAALGAAAVLVVAALFVPGVVRGPGRWIALALAAGLAAVTCARLLADRFDAAASYYNAWMRPGFYILLASGVAARVRSVRVTAAVAAGLLGLAHAWGVYQLAAHGDYFAHGPHRKVVALIRGLGDDGVALVHDAGSSRIDFLYRPLRYEFGRGLPHYRFAGTSEGRSVVANYNPAGPAAWPAAALPYRYLLVVRTTLTGFDALAEQIRDGDRTLGEGPVAQELRGSPDWRFLRRALFVASDAAEITLFERRPRATEPGPSLDARGQRPVSRR
jgi:hypothetical protein